MSEEDNILRPEKFTKIDIENARRLKALAEEIIKEYDLKTEERTRAVCDGIDSESIGKETGIAGLTDRGCDGVHIGSEYLPSGKKV